MTRMHCKACGKRYNYETNGCCPECGAYNRPPHRQSIGTDGMVHDLREEHTEEQSGAFGALIGREISELLHRDTDEEPEDYGEKECYEEKECCEEKVCYEEKSCFEEQAQRVRSRGLHTPNLSGLRSQRQRGKENGKPGSKKGLIILVAALALTAIFNMIANRTDDFSGGDDWSVEWTDEESVLPEEIFMLDGYEMQVTDWHIIGDELSITVAGDDSDSVWAELRGYQIDTGDEELISPVSFDLYGDTTSYTFAIIDVDMIDSLVLHGDENSVAVTLDLHRAEVGGEHFGWQEEELALTDWRIEREGPGKVLDDLYLNVGILSTNNDLELESPPQLWTSTDGGVLNVVEAERADYEYARCDLRYHLGRRENIERMTLYFPDCGDGAYWVILQ